MSKFNGHKNWNHWNVSLWLSNDEYLYRKALFFIEKANNRDTAALLMLRFLHDYVGIKTADGALFSMSSVRAAMRGMEA